jgi:hypothetical protein
MAVALGIPASILNLVQTGLLERAFHDSLFPALLYRAEALAEQWAGHTGVQILQTRAGLLAPIITPGVPGVDPSPQTATYEQWFVNLQRYYGTIDTHMPTSAVGNADQFVRNIQTIGLQAGQSMNRLARNAIFQAYISGQTMSTSAQLSTDTQIAVASVNGFTSVVLTGSKLAPTPVSSATPLPITIPISGGSTLSAFVIGVVLNNPSDPNSPGTLLLAAALGTAVPIRTPVLSTNAPQVIRSGGGNGVDSITAVDTMVWQDIANAVAVLRANNVQPHEDGYYHGHIFPTVNAQVFADAVWQRVAGTALPDHPIYKQGFIGSTGGVSFNSNSESPNANTTSGQVSTGTSAIYAYDVGGEVVNNAGVNIQRTLITGKGAMLEKWLDEGLYISEAGVNGKIGEFDILNNGIAVTTDRIRLTIRAPIDRLQEVVGSSWSTSTCFPIPSDLTATTSNALFKRACIIESAG